MALLLVSVAVFLYFFTPLGDMLSGDRINQLKAWVQAQGALAPVVYAVLYIVATIVCLPGSVLTILAGLMFGILWGFVLVVVAANLGALCAFSISRYVGRDMAQRFLKGRLGSFDESIGANGFTVVFWFRLIPIFPFNALNYAFGLTKVSMPAYVLGSLLGMLPGMFVYVSLGNATSHVSLTDLSVWTRTEIWGPFALVILLSFLPRLFRQKHRELKNLANPPDKQDPS